MGHRTVVMLANDQAHEWGKDERLAGMIHSAMAKKAAGMDGDLPRGYGDVVEVCHGDRMTLAILDGYYTFNPLSTTFFTTNKHIDEQHLTLLKEAADKMGYRLVKKSTKPS